MKLGTGRASRNSAKERELITDLRVTGKRDRNRYPHRLQWYNVPPIDNISLEEFEEFAVERLKVLRDVENLSFRHKKESKEYKTDMETLTRHYLPVTYKTREEKTTDDEMFDERRKDHISHFILRLAYCRSEDLRRWFITQEVELFRRRFDEENTGDINRFLKINDLKYEPITLEEKMNCSNELRDAGFRLDTQKVASSDYFKVYFTEALDLVRSRKVYLEKGYAFVPQSELVSIIANVYRTRLSHALAVTARSLPYLEEDERLLPMLKNLSRQYIGQDYGQKKQSVGGKVTLNQIDSLSRTSFPLCMRQLHQALRENHHLKHGGRLQYGLFLKGIGLTLEEALAFWRSEFSKMMDVDKFDKQYAYNIRHNYGKEGKRADYTPYSCMKVIMSNQPGPGDQHGCPFRHTDADLLRQRLAAYKVQQKDQGDILDMVKESHYQLACTRYFEVTHGVTVASAFQHPNQYFEESRRVFTEGGRGGITEHSTSSGLQHAIKREMNPADSSGLQHAIKREVNPADSSKSAESHEEFDYLMQDDEENMVQEIEGMETV